MCTYRYIIYIVKTQMRLPQITLQMYKTQLCTMQNTL